MNVLDLLQKHIQEDIDTRVATLRSGGCNPEQYQSTCGQIRGLELAGEHVKALRERMEKDDE